MALLDLQLLCKSWPLKFPITNMPMPMCLHLCATSSSSPVLFFTHTTCSTYYITLCVPQIIRSQLPASSAAFCLFKRCSCSLANSFCSSVSHFSRNAIYFHSNQASMSPTILLLEPIASTFLSYPLAKQASCQSHPNNTALPPNLVPP